MKKTLTLILSLFAFAAHADGLVIGQTAPQKGVEVVDPVLNASVRYGVKCYLRLDSQGPFLQDYGLCNISRGLGEGRDRVTIIDTGVVQYKLIRSERYPDEATFFVNGRPYDSVTARGSCWAGESVTFCAD